MTKLLSAIGFVAYLTAGTAAFAADPVATINRVSAEGIGDVIGTVTVTSSANGAVFNVSLKGLPPGERGTHVHQNGACGTTVVNGNPVAAGAAGGHWDEGTGKHEGPSGRGHIGDLPVLDVAADGTATRAIIVPRIKDVEAIRGRAIVFHAGGDNFADTPAILGGGGARIACGVFK